MKSRAVGLTLAFLVMTLPAACGSGSAAETTSSPPAATLSMPAKTVLIKAYFLRSGKLAATGRKTVHTLGVANASLGALITGPTVAERGIGFRSALPSGIEQRRVVIEHNVLTVSLTKNINRPARAQIVTTLTQFSTIRKVVLVTPAGTSRPLTRADFESLSPSVLVESPLPFASVRSPFRVTGSSNTFEAVSQLELLNQDGVVLARKTVTASSGTGTRGTFSVTLSFDAPAGPATLVSYESSAKDGSRIDVVRIPVRITG